jgi:hypothetical protein
MGIGRGSKGMNNAEYEKYEAVFRPLAIEIMTQIRAMLTANGFNFHPVEVVDHDVDRGIWFVETGAQPPRAVQLMLIDGEELGFEGVGLKLDCSDKSSGVIWKPYNFTEQVGTTDLAELKCRLLSLNECIEDVVTDILAEWDTELAEIGVC